MTGVQTCALPISLRTGDACRDELVEHLTRGVDWVRAVGAMAASGTTTFIETGPGKVLTGLVKRIAPDAAAIAMDEPDGDRPYRVPTLD